MRKKNLSCQNKFFALVRQSEQISLKRNMPKVKQTS